MAARLDVVCCADRLPARPTTTSQPLAAAAASLPGHTSLSGVAL